MQGLKRSIPRVAAASLVFGGAGCAATSAPSPLEVGLARCQGISHCDPTYFSDYWSSIDECADEYAAYWEMETPNPDACDDARLIFQACVEDAYYGTCDVFAAINACVEEQERVTRRCDP